MKKLLITLVLGAMLIPSLVSAASLNRNLSVGMTGSDVKTLQQFLKDQGIYKGSVNSTFGSTTKEAVIAFQKKESIVPASGLVGSLTRTKINSTLIGNANTVTNLSNSNFYTNVDGNKVHSPAYSSNGIPAGATARCRDGTYSFSLNNRGTCSRHGGVSSWLR